MKILLSSKYLALKLSEIDFDKESVWNVSLNDRILNINTATKCIQVHVEVIRFAAQVRQDHRRWVWIYHVVRNVSECPIVLEIRENVTDLIFQF